MSKFRGFIAIDIKVFPKLLEFEKEIKKTDANVHRHLHLFIKPDQFFPYAGGRLRRRVFTPGFTIPRF